MPRLPSSFGVDADGELYIVNYFSGSIHRIVLAPVGPPPTTAAAAAVQLPRNGSVR